MMFTAPSLMFTVATAGCESYAANDATLAGSELDVQSQVVQHGCVGVEGPRNGSAVALTVAKHGFWAVTGVWAEWRKQQKLGVA